MTMNQEPSWLSLPDRRLAYQQHNATPGQENRPTVLFLGGFASDMTGTKARFLRERCAQTGTGLVCFDYRGHGASSGSFADHCISDWFDDALCVFDRLITGPCLLVGSSMGGWIGLLLARARPGRLAGFVGVAAAPDFTEDLIKPSLTPAQQKDLDEKGHFYEFDEQPDSGEQQIPITRKLLDDGAGCLVLRTPLTIGCPVRLLQGQRDTEVPWPTALAIAKHIQDEDVQVTLIKDGDHRLSRPQDVEQLWAVMTSLGKNA